MLNIIWFTLMLLSVITGALNGTLDQVAAQVTLSSQKAFSTALNLSGVMILWLGFMNIAQDAGLVQSLGRLCRPVLYRLFPDIPKDHPALGAIALNLSANILGLNNAATPFGIKAMEELESLNKTPSVASDDMCMLLAINTSSIQLIPATAIGLLAAAGSSAPTVIILSTLAATSISTAVAIFLSFKFRNKPS
ncbi:nucleoside recognition domain-containing protein [Candidatus Synchoanobacter obligatus]|uniref:Nucleoside recognition protein n=1 Tax=Candidatus Synchoanobacter obligatus TaxID=2919597 RepID=A0ABT1L601_9GAMM|nr:nucleoside recognition domain-containing protein [Candidatus Synchoanobacter obligatus]MCP8352293.1 nucleoside recognition protein [Candidatus Synchoanobacter obligatus]